MRAPASSQHSHGRADRPVERADLVVVEPTGSSGRVETGAPQRLVGEQVAETGKTSLIHEPRLERCVRAIEHHPQLRERERGRVDTESSFIGIEFDTSETARVAQSARVRTATARASSRPGSVPARRASSARATR